MQSILELTADGSHTLYIPSMDEHYHSVNGAIQESVHVYIEAGLNQCNKPHVNVLEFGFGTGLNVLLTFREAQRRQFSVSYTALEKYPLPETLTGCLNYGRALNLPEVFEQLHTSVWNEPVEITPFFSLQKIETDFLHYNFPACSDVVFYDAFAPDKQPEAWSQTLFDKIRERMYPHGILTTYCAKGNVRRMLQHAGFVVERIPGPPGKREMLRGRC
ncbi:MAG: tRNA (5-methylaminomethyl-2-thiouridine)(34)-methyltransferase MnmD [Dysgonamonadaceae bacterium]|jgi:tRNA U34 5-methylaminomethyl-2-thiouridine-forming methyltransferase MnmC|nr:tRNA (5-methylaminomethyl-2-thiouridine)(34)-methyltransferase MnmD [Dysgonamonadaceae bacterium]